MCISRWGKDKTEDFGDEDFEDFQEHQESTFPLVYYPKYPNLPDKTDVDVFIREEVKVTEQGENGNLAFGVIRGSLYIGGTNKAMAMTLEFIDQMNYTKDLKFQLFVFRKMLKGLVSNWVHFYVFDTSSESSIFRGSLITLSFLGLLSGF